MGAVLLVPVQGHVPHAVYRLRQVPPPEHDGPLADHDLHDCRGHLLCPHPGPCHQHYPESGQFPETVQRKGRNVRDNVGINPVISFIHHSHCWLHSNTNIEYFFPSTIKQYKMDLSSSYLNVSSRYLGPLDLGTF